MKPGKLFEQEIKRSLVHLGCFHFRIADHSSYTPFMAKGSQIRIPKQPGDFFAVHQGIPCLIEAKTSKAADSYSVTYIRDHQLDANREIIASGGLGWFLINNRNNPRNSQVWYVSAEEIKSLQKQYKRKAIKWENFPEDRRITKIKAGIWNLEPIFQPKHL